jgi:hypothetical protein
LFLIDCRKQISFVCGWQLFKNYHRNDRVSALLRVMLRHRDDMLSVNDPAAFVGVWEIESTKAGIRRFISSLLVKSNGNLSK